MELYEVNALDEAQFVQALGWIFENSPWVAERAWLLRPFRSLQELEIAMVSQMEAGSRKEQMQLLRAHPDLGTRMKVSPASAGEQAGAGLDQLTESEYELLLDMNIRYKEKFRFPFLYAVKGSSKLDILEALRKRLQSSPREEFNEALRQVGRIAHFRLQESLT